MKTIEVVAAVIHENDKFLATERGYGEFEGLWEFPGGKIEKGESKEEALKREIKEELCIDINIRNLICTISYTYPSFNLIMHCFECNISNGKLVLNEHKSAQWLEKQDFDNIEWLPADIEVIKILKEKAL